MSTQEIIDDILAHVGVKGMKWGVRKSFDTAFGTKTAGRKPSSYKKAQKTGDVVLSRGFGITTTGSRRRSAASSRKGSQAVSVIDKRRKVKTSGGQRHPAHPDAVRAHTIGRVAKKSGTKALSNEELQVLARRMQLEQSVKQLSNNQKNAGQKFAVNVLKQGGNKVVQEITGGAMTQVKKQLTKHITR